MGLSGSGKSFISKILHEDFGFEWIRSDVVRKELMSLKPHQSAKAEYGKGIYTEEITRMVYTKMVEMAKKLVEEGKSVVLDATFLTQWQRNLVKENFPDAVFILATASEEEIKRRLSNRVDVSDADFSIYLEQKKRFLPPDYAITIDTQMDIQSIKDRLRRVLNL